MENSQSVFPLASSFLPESTTLNAGDIRVRLSNTSGWGPKRQLEVRFIYPAALALERMALDGWLENLFEQGKGAYVRIKKSTEPIIESTGGLKLRARLHSLARFPLRPVFFRLAPTREASVYHLKEAGQLLYIDVAGPPSLIDGVRESVLKFSGDGIE